MRSLPRIHLLHRLLQACFAAAVYALLLPTTGPLFDHHFAERLPGHLHVYPGGIPVRHSHPFETPHTHDAPSDNLASPDGLIFLPPQDEGATAGSVALAVALLAAAVVLASPPLRRQRAAAGPAAVDGLLPPPEPPPPRLRLA